MRNVPDEKREETKAAEVSKQAAAELKQADQGTKPG